MVNVFLGQVFLKITIVSIRRIKPLVNVYGDNGKGRHVHHGGIEKVKKGKTVCAAGDTDEDTVSLFYHVIIQDGLFQPFFQMEK
jgi:hypothetical protein